MDKLRNHVANVLYYTLIYFLHSVSEIFSYSSRFLHVLSVLKSLEFSKQLQAGVIWFLNVLAMGIILFLLIQMRNFPYKAQLLVAKFSSSIGKSAFLCREIGRLEQLQNSTPCKLGALHIGKRPKVSSSLEKASELTFSNCDVLGYRKGIFYLMVIYFFFSLLELI